MPLGGSLADLMGESAHKTRVKSFTTLQQAPRPCIELTDT